MEGIKTTESQRGLLWFICPSKSSFQAEYTPLSTLWAEHLGDQYLALEQSSHHVLLSVIPAR
jgi:hypothetical protein